MTTPAPAAAARPEPTGRRWMGPGREVFFLTALAFAVRLAAWLLRPAILPDSADILAAADSVRALGGDAALRSTHHPLPIWLLGQAGARADLEMWGSLGAALLASLAVGPIHVVARAAGGRHAATMACLLYAVLPKAVSVGSVPLAEPVFLPLAIGALALAMTCGVAHSPLPRAGRPLLAGAAAAMSYLARPEGLAVGALVVATAAVRSRRPDRLRAALLASFAFAAVAGPWVAQMSSDAGALVLSPKKDLAAFAGLDAAPAEGTGVAAAVRDVAGAAWGALGPAILLVPLGLLPWRRWRRKRSRRARALLLGGAVLLTAVLFRVAAGWGYAGGRHALTAGVLLLPFAGEGFLVLVAWVSRTFRRRRAALFLAMLLTIPLAVTAVLRPDGESGERERALGEQIAAAELASGRADDVVVGSFQESLVAYYADRVLRGTGRRARNQRLRRDHKALLLKSADFEGQRADLVAALRRGGASWLVLRLFDRAVTDGVERAPGEDLARRLTADGAIGAPVLAAGELAAFPVLR